MAISLRAVVLTIVIIVAAVSAIAIFVPIDIATVTAIDELVSELRSTTSRSLVHLTAAQFDPPRTLALNLHQLFRLGTLNPADGSHLMSLIPTLCTFAATTPYSPFIGTATDDFAGCQRDEGAMYRDAATGAKYDAPVAPPFFRLNTSLSTLDSPDFNVTAEPWYQELKDRGGWSTFFVHSGRPLTAEVVVGMPLYSPHDGSFVGVVGVSMWARDLIIALRAVTIGDTGRAMVFDASLGHYLAGNFNQSSVVGTGAQRRLAWVNDTTDALIVAALCAVGGQSGLQQLPQTYAASMPYGDGDTAYLDVAPITDSMGLNLRVLTVLRRSDFTGLIDEHQLVAIWIAVTVVVVLAMLSAVVVWWITAPLAEVAESMNLSKSMSDEAPADAKLSGLSEILAIQVAYGQLCAELKRVRSYLPDSILRRLDGVVTEEADDEEEVLSACLSKSADARSGSGHRSAAAAPDSDPRDAARASGSGTRRSGGGSGGGATAAERSTGLAAIELALALTTRRISVLALNLRGTHGHVGRRGAAALSELCGRYLEIVHEAAKASRGVVQLMHGDRVFVGFNAASRVASHATMAVETAEAVRQRVQGELGMDVTAGVATGDAVVGLLGNAAVKQFTVVGRPFVHAAALERLCLCATLLPQKCESVDGTVGRPLHVLTDRATLSSARFTIAMRAVDIVALPHASRPQMIATVLSDAESNAVHTCDGIGDSSTAGAQLPGDASSPHTEGFSTVRAKTRASRSSGDREWMYEVSRATASNVFSAYTEAMDSFAEGNVATGTAKLMDVTAAAIQPLVRATKARFAQLVAAGHPNAAALASELGPYYYSGFAACDTPTASA